VPFVPSHPKTKLCRSNCPISVHLPHASTKWRRSMAAMERVALEKNRKKWLAFAL
jgi:hypothetical protein